MSRVSTVPYPYSSPYGVATISRPLRIIGLFCKRVLLKRRYSAKETYDFKEPANRSPPHNMVAFALSSAFITASHGDVNFKREVILMTP